MNTVVTIDFRKDLKDNVQNITFYRELNIYIYIYNYLYIYIYLNKSQISQF